PYQPGSWAWAKGLAARARASRLSVPGVIFMGSPRAKAGCDRGHHRPGTLIVVVCNATVPVPVAPASSLPFTTAPVPAEMSPPAMMVPLKVVPLPTAAFEAGTQKMFLACAPL